MRTHAWNVSVSEATAIQKELQRRVIHAPLARAPRTIAGADVSSVRFGKVVYACVVVLSYPELIEIERAFSTHDVTFPYVPGYLSFREIPAIQDAYEKLVAKPDLIMMDGHGIAHPRRLGVASHLGLSLDRPTIGCAKSRLFGTGVEPDAKAGSIAELKDPRSGEVLGTYVRTKDNVQPVIVSVGHKITLEEAIAFTLTSVHRHRIPEPTRLAHNLVNIYRKEA